MKISAFRITDTSNSERRCGDDSVIIYAFQHAVTSGYVLHLGFFNCLHIFYYSAWKYVMHEMQLEVHKLYRVNLYLHTA